MAMLRVNRSGFRRKDGTYIEPESFLIKDRGLKGRTEGIHLQKGALHGYKVHLPTAIRRRILRAVAKREGKKGPGLVVKRLTDLANISTRNKSKKTTRIARSDVKWAQHTLEHQT